MTNEPLKLSYTVPGDDFTRAGEASSNVKKVLKQLGYPSQVIRRIAIALYEGEINMVIHANGGKIEVEIFPDRIVCVLRDEGPGIADVGLAMQEGYSTASAQVRDLGFGAGMGLSNMKRYADCFQIDTVVGKGTTVTVEVGNPS